MNSRERVRLTLNLQQADCVPLDLGAAPTSGMHVSSVYRLRQALKLDTPETPVKVVEPYQMLGEIQPDLMDVLGVDVVGLWPPRNMFGFRNEGWKPWRLFDGTRGAHPLEYIRPPDWDKFYRLQLVSGNRIQIVTLVPEQPGALEFIHHLAQSGVIPALGYTIAIGEQIHAAVEAGARLVTHLGNGVAAVLPRHENPIWNELAEDTLQASLIFDGFHLPANAMKVILWAKGIERSMLVSDASALARITPGIYETPEGGRWS